MPLTNWSRADSTGAVASKSRPLCNPSRDILCTSAPFYADRLSLVSFIASNCGNECLLPLHLVLQLQKQMQSRTSMNYFKSHHTQTQISRCYCKLSKASLSCICLYFATFLFIFYSFSPHPHLEGLRIHPSIQKYISTSYYIPLFSHVIF